MPVAVHITHRVSLKNVLAQIQKHLQRRIAADGTAGARDHRRPSRRRRKAADAAAGARDLRRLSAQEGGGRRCWSTGSQETVNAGKQRMPLSVVVII
jgi:hypothetical protein